MSQSGRLTLDSIYEKLGYNPETRRFVVGSLNGTREEIAEDFTTMLKNVGHSEDEASAIFESSYGSCDMTEDTVMAIDEPLELIQKLKDVGMKIAVCTSDCRANALQVLKTIGIAEQVDMLVCGDDKGCKPKPDPHNAQWICKSLGVDPSSGVIVGDSPADVGMAQAAGLTSIAVLSGLSPKSELEDADHIVPSIGHILPKILP